MSDNNEDSRQKDWGEFERKIEEVEINKEPVELYKILKFEGMVPSGAEAKIVIADELVLVNGDIETRKRRKIVSGDMIEFNGDRILIKLAET